VIDNEMEMSGYSNEMFVLAGVVLALVFVFLCICVVCDKHLVPAVETIIEEFDVPEEIAAVTLIAFGSSSPEILLNTVR
jgi:Ca2+/Na+ antiporter